MKRRVRKGTIDGATVCILNLKCRPEVSTSYDNSNDTFIVVIVVDLFTVMFYNPSLNHGNFKPPKFSSRR